MTDDVNHPRAMQVLFAVLALLVVAVIAWWISSIARYGGSSMADRATPALRA